MLALRDQDGNAWTASNCPYRGLATRTAVPEQSWLLPNGTEVLVAAKLHRDSLRDPVRAGGGDASARAAVAPASTASAPTSSPPSPTSCARR